MGGFKKYDKELSPEPTKTGVDTATKVFVDKEKNPTEP